jgi:manganese oxidase
MKRIMNRRNTLISFVVTFSLLIGGVTAHAVFIPGTTGPNFNLTAKPGFIYADDGNSIHMWGYANGTPATAGPMQYPGPTLIVNQGQSISVTLYNQLPGVNCSIVFPGQTGVVATGGVPGLLTNEAAPGGSVTYTFVASEPGTYTYYSGTRPELQVEMGLVGALIVRPTMGANYGYNHADSFFHHEYLFLLSEIDHIIHEKVLLGQMGAVDNTTAFPVYWFVNGRAAFDTLAPHNALIFPNQPYGALARTHPGEKVLVRMIGAGRDAHPYHLHGNHHLVIARDGRLLKGPMGEDLSEFAFTTTVAPGQTFDAIFTWTGEGMGWDIYGHTDPTGTGLVGQACVDAGVPLEPNEPLEDHCRPVPVSLPHIEDLTFGPLWSGNPVVGSPGPLPPGEGGFNPNSGLTFMWHSHNEKELTSNNIFPGGMMTFIIVEHPSVPIP